MVTLPHPHDPTESIFGIVPQDQPTGRTCVQTCLAMAIGVPVKKVIEKWGDQPMGQQELLNALTECRVVWNQMTTGTMVHEGWYLATVPSLNHRGGHHQVLVRYTREDGVCVLDPAMGNKYRRDGHDLISWAYLTPFWPGGELPNR